MNTRGIAPPFLAALLLCAGCSNLPGRPAPTSIPIDPDNVTDFDSLYHQNCSGCHGVEAKGGAALSLGDPVYLAIADDATLHKVVTNGIAETSMAAFAKSAGGMLTENQVDIIARGIRARYSRPDALAGSRLRHTPQLNPATPSAAPVCTKPFVPLATVQTAKAAQRPALLSTAPSSRSSLIRNFARWSSSAAPISTLQTGVTMFPASPCPLQIFPTLSPG